MNVSMPEKRLDGETVMSKNDLTRMARSTVRIACLLKPERLNQDSWVNLYGKHNRLDNSYFAGKSNRGVTISVQLNDGDSLENHHRIDHTYFGPRPALGSNGGETIRIGNSWSSLSDSLTVVEKNVFDRCDGEVEIVSNKSGGNVFRRNLFYESRGTLTLRHGNNNLVEDNVFLGNRVPHTGGIFRRQPLCWYSRTRNSITQVSNDATRRN